MTSKFFHIWLGWLPQGWQKHSNLKNGTIPPSLTGSSVFLPHLIEVRQLFFVLCYEREDDVHWSGFAVDLVEAGTVLQIVCDWRIWQVATESGVLNFLVSMVHHLASKMLDSQLWLLTSCLTWLSGALDLDYSLQHLAAQLISVLKPYAGKLNQFLTGRNLIILQCLWKCQGVSNDAEAIHHYWSSLNRFCLCVTWSSACGSPSFCNIEISATFINLKLVHIKASNLWFLKEFTNTRRKKIQILK